RNFPSFSRETESVTVSALKIGAIGPAATGGHRVVLDEAAAQSRRRVQGCEVRDCSPMGPERLTWRSVRWRPAFCLSSRSSSGQRTFATDDTCEPFPVSPRSRCRPAAGGDLLLFLFGWRVVAPPGGAQRNKARSAFSRFQAAPGRSANSSPSPGLRTHPAP